MDLNRLKAIGALVIAAQGFAAKSDVTLAWNPVQGVAITNYTVFWGTNSGVYILQANAGTQTSLAVTNLSSNTVYYLAASATAQDGTQSPFSSEVIYTNSPATPSPVLPVTNGTAGGGTTNITNSSGSGSSGTNSGSGSSGTNSGSGSSGTNSGGGSSGTNSGGGSSGTNSGSGSTGEVSIPGIPPALTLSFGNNQPMLAVLGTMGSTLAIQSSTNPANPDSWNTITNLAMTNPAAGAPTNPGSPSVINLAFVPAAQNYQVLDTVPPACEFYQAVMPYDYMVLADSVLSGQGYPSRLLLVRMPGILSDDVCYVTAPESFICYDTTNQAFGLESSGPAIRQIAITLSTSLGQNWTSASEFSYSNGVTTILATVVEADPASTDPAAAASTPSIQIDF